ncbi:hypothetical protein TNCV_1946211 [Trichonephila clavipes]|uniref:Uncharacterized protein n=1 Tax=Trichonephila clavipes TaxID=2585209 RepID=A0A8X6SBG3_TRICX|nr:hypothetical protein TNCV_1946211 [Trichonephila clavipes]
MKVLKREMSPEQLIATSSVTIDNRFPTSEWLHVFTDGSPLDRYHGAGAGTFCELVASLIARGKTLNAAWRVKEITPMLSLEWNSGIKSSGR